MKRVLTAFLILLFLTVFTSQVSAAWELNGNPVSAASEDQRYQNITTDGAGGGIVVWEDSRYGIRDIFAQRFSPDGTMLWANDGIPVCTAAENQYRPVIVSDGAGGAFIAWGDHREKGDGYDIYAQRIDANGIPLWAPNGVAVCTAELDQHRPNLTQDGEGGVIITWHDSRNNFYHVYGQKLDGDGNALWTPDGVKITRPHDIEGCTQAWAIPVSDGAGGAIVAWHADCYGDVYDREVHIRRIYASGDSLWPGVTVVGALTCGRHFYPAIVSDNNGGAIVAWPYNESGMPFIMYAQRVGPDGTRLWQAGGKPIATSADYMDYPFIATDGHHGAYVTWTDEGEQPGSGVTDIFMQRVTADGTPSWASKLLLAEAEGRQHSGYIIPDGSYGAVVSWTYYYGDDLGDIYSQKVDSTGFLHWGDSGVPVCIQPNAQVLARPANDIEGGAFVSWYDHRYDDFDIYVKKVDPSYIPPAIDHAPAILYVNDVPGDQGGQMTLIWRKSDLDIEQYPEIDHYEIWRRIEYADPVYMQGPEPDPDRRIRFIGGQAGYAFEWLMDMPARFFDSYAATIPSLHDSTGLGTGWQYFMVSAVTWDPYVFYDSPVDSGYSVDNLSPCMPAGMIAEQSFEPEGLGLSWDMNEEPDLNCYHVYRGLSDDFIPEPANLIASAPVAEYFDGEWTYDSGYWYKVAAVDIHGNESEFAITGPGTITGDDPAPVPSATFLEQNFPNPFNPNTTIAFGLKESGHVSLRIFDAAGRLVRTLVDESRPAGQYDVVWNGKAQNGANAASGVYFYRLISKEFEETRKMILLR